MKDELSLHIFNLLLVKNYPHPYVPNTGFHRRNSRILSRTVVWSKSETKLDVVSIAVY